MYDETVTNRINALEGPYREFVLSEMPGVIAESFGEAYQFDEKRTGVLGNAIILLLTFLLSREQFVEFVAAECGLPASEATDLSWGIVSSLPSDISEAYLATARSLNQEVPDVPFDLAAEINQAETTLGSIPQVRTMPQTPAGSEPVYTSTQAAILHESTATPATTDPNAPRWDTGH